MAKSERKYNPRDGGKYGTCNNISEGREIRTPNLLIWGHTRCHCAIPPHGFTEPRPMDWATLAPLCSLRRTRCSRRATSATCRQLFSVLLSFASVLLFCFVRSLLLCGDSWKWHLFRILAVCSLRCFKGRLWAWRGLMLRGVVLLQRPPFLVTLVLLLQHGSNSRMKKKGWTARVVSLGGSPSQ